VNDRTADRLMWASDRTCNLCQKETRHLEIHHIDGNPGNSSYNNLILLCRNCHSEATVRGLGRKPSGSLLLRYKTFWESVIQKRRSAVSSGDARLEEAVLKVRSERVVKTFENYMIKRDAQGVLSLFTPPKTKAERDWLENYILGGNLGKPGGFVRLFATRGFGYRVLKYDMRKLRIVNPKKTEVIVEEWRTWWNDGAWDPVPIRYITRLVLTKIGNEWFIDKYHQPADANYQHKYGGLDG